VCVYLSVHLKERPAGLAFRKIPEDVRLRLAPPFRALARSDSRVGSALPLMSLTFTEESRKFIRVLNEILMAEVLAVKKTLGNAHEAGVVKSLEKIGESV
jgi:hypothetical protein